MLRSKLVFVLTFVSTLLSAQTLSTTNRSWQYLTGGKVAAPDSIWDEPSYFPTSEQLIPLGFTFTAFGKPMDSVWLDQAGILSLDEEVWMGVWEDLCDKGFGKRKPVSPIRIVSSGTAGNKKLEIEWRNFGFYGDFDAHTACTDSANLRMTLFEKTQTMEMWFGPSKIEFPAQDFPKGVVIFLDRLDSQKNATGIDLKGDPANPTTVPVNETTHSTLNSWPANGTVYTFSFPNLGTEKVPQKFISYHKNGMIYISPGDNEVKIFAANGKEVFARKCSGNCEITGIPAGVYYVWVAHNNQKKNYTIIIE